MTRKFGTRKVNKINKVSHRNSVICKVSQKKSYRRLSSSFRTRFPNSWAYILKEIAIVGTLLIFLQGWSFFLFRATTAYENQRNYHDMMLGAVPRKLIASCIESIVHVHILLYYRTINAYSYCSDFELVSLRKEMFNISDIAIFFYAFYFLYIFYLKIF